MIEATVLIVTGGRRKGGWKYSEETIGLRKENLTYITLRDPMEEK